MPEAELSSDQRDRQAWMGLLARSAPDDLNRLWAATGQAPGFDWLRVPETGAVMVRGRAGGTGAAFNLGEMTVTRCALRLEDGAVGHAVVQGRDKAKAEIAAKVDALMQGARAAEVRAGILDPLADLAAGRAQTRAAKSAATKVEFFTMVRGEG